MTKETNIIDVIKEVADDVNLPKKISKTLGILFGPVVKETGLFWSDIMRERIIRRQANFFVDFQNHFESKGLKLKVLPDKFLITVIDEVGNQDDEPIRKLWLNLLADTCESEEHSIHMTLASVLKDIGPGEAKVLSYLHQGEVNNKINGRNRRYMGRITKLVEEVSIDRNRCDLLVDNLVRVGLIEQFRGTKQYSVTRRFTLTNLGNEMMKRCQS